MIPPKVVSSFQSTFFHHSEIEKAFIRAAQRGVKIRGLLHHHKSFALGYVYRTKGTAKRMNEGGVTDLHFGPGHLFTHSKFLIKDRQEIALGTGNWLHEDVLIHPQLYIYLKDAPLAKKLAKELEQQISEQSTGKMTLN